MSGDAIIVEKLAKRYTIGSPPSKVSSPQLLLKKFFGPFRPHVTNAQASSSFETIWALKDVSFTIQQGEVVGIVGNNGAGKSTLLKILSRITEPTHGQATVRGHIGSLLEVGTGFHPELTGRENIYLYGAVLGLRRAEIHRMFEEIVSFSGVEKFLDTPVKRYSSGMYVRLAFAVAAHLQPEILLVDEVLAVGDGAFQKKCLGKMGDVAKQGRTVLFVSHNMVAIQNLCSRSIWLDSGKVRGEGPTSRIIADYMADTFSAQTEQLWSQKESAPGNDIVRLHRVHVRPKIFENELRPDSITMATPLVVEVEYWSQIPDTRLHVGLRIHTEQQLVAFTTSSLDSEPTLYDFHAPGLYKSICEIPGDFLNAGVHRIGIFFVRDGHRIVYRHEEALTFEVLDLGMRPGTRYGKEVGVVHPKLPWTTQQLEAA